MTAPILQQAMAFHRSGNLAEAERLYLSIVAAEPRNFVAQQMLGTLRLQQGRAADAVLCFDRVIAAKPDMIEAHNNRGIALCSLQRYAEAVPSFDRALALNPKAPDTWVSRAVALHALKRGDDALASLKSALSIEPRFLPGLTASANLLAEYDRFAEALQFYDAALALEPRDTDLRTKRARALLSLKRSADALTELDDVVQRAANSADAWNYRGSALRSLGRLSDAAESFQRAVTLRPNHAAAHYNLALTSLDLRRYDAALIGLDRVVAINASNAEAWNDRALALKGLSRRDEALASVDRALALNPNDARAHNNRGTILWDLGRIDDAIASLDRALALDPHLALALHNRGTLMWGKKRNLEVALRDLEHALEVDPDKPFVRGDLLHYRMFAGVWDGFTALNAAIDAGVRAGRQVILPFVYQAVAENPADLLACAKAYAATQFPAAPAVVTRRKRGHDKIRVGYLCGEFRDHATGYLTAGLYEHHDRARFEVVGFDSGARDDSPMRRRLEAAFDRFTVISGATVQEACARIAEAAIDILVNLNGYYGDGRSDVFAQRPAPIQVNYLGFPGTLGASYIDYIVADRIVLPPGEEQYYTERVVRLPGCYQVNDAKRARPDLTTTRAEQGLPEEAFVFCHFNHTYKITPLTFAKWMDILKRAPNSVLWLLTSGPLFSANIRRAALAHGVDPARVVLAPIVKHADHLARQSLGDLFLDSLPYNAHTTASEALWMGLPLLTCRGSTFPGRVAASLLTALDVPERITETWDEYTARATELARDPAAMTQVRNKLSAARGTSPLFDTMLYARRLETAYKRMIARWENGEGPVAFDVAP